MSEPEAASHKSSSKRRHHKIKRSSSPPPSNHKSSPEADSRDSISHIICNLCFQYINWTYNLRPENLWETKFGKILENVTCESQVTVDELFIQLAEHTHQGRIILTEVKFTGSGRCDEEYGVLMDLFIQGFKLAVGLTSEVKFFKVKLDKFAPASPSEAFQMFASIVIIIYQTSHV